MEPSQRFAALVATSGEHLPLDEAALLIAACAEPDLRLRRRSWPSSTCWPRRARATRSTPSCPTCSAGVASTGDRADYYDPRNSLLNHVLERRLGIPITLSVLALEVGRRIGVPMAGVGMPGHFLLQDKVDRVGLHRPVPRRPAPRRAGLPAALPPAQGPGDLVVGRLPGAGGQPVDRGPDAEQPAGDLRPAPRLRRAALGAGALSRPPAALRRRPRRRGPSHGPSELNFVAASARFDRRSDGSLGASDASDRDSGGRPDPRARRASERGRRSDTGPAGQYLRAHDRDREPDRRAACRRPDRRAAAGAPAGQHRRRAVPRRPVRPGPGVGPLPGGPRRPRPVAPPAEPRQRAGPGRRRAQPVLPQPDRLRDVRADRRGVGERGAEAPLPAPALHRRGDLVPALLRAGQRVRLRRAVGAAASGTATSGSSTVRRSGRRWPTSRSGVCSSSGPTRRP